MGPVTKPVILVVDDSPADRRLAGAIIDEGLECDVAFAEDGISALAALGRTPVRIVLTDLAMPGMSGLELVEAIRNHHPGVPVVLMTAYGNEDVAIEALRKGATSYVPKRTLDRDLVETLEQVLAAAQVE